MESAANRLQKEAKGYLDSLRGQLSVTGLRWEEIAQGLTYGTAMTASQMRIAETIDAFYGDAGANDGVSRSYKQAVEDLDAETIKALDGPFRYVVWRGIYVFEKLRVNCSQANSSRTDLKICCLLPRY